MIKRLLAEDGVIAICQFRDDGAYVEGYGLWPEQQMIGLAKFAHEYKRIVQGNADQLSMFTGLNGWTPPGGWVVHGQAMSVCSIANLVCVFENSALSLSHLLSEMRELSSW
jgi:roadblock/LC7 domain-containing protein